MVSEYTCKLMCLEDPNCVYIDFNPVDGCYHSTFCQEKIIFANSNIYHRECGILPDCDQNQIKTLAGASCEDTQT